MLSLRGLQGLQGSLGGSLPWGVPGGSLGGREGSWEVTSRGLLGSIAPLGTHDFPLPLVLGPQAPRFYGGSGEETGGGGGIMLCQKYTRCFWNLPLFSSGLRAHVSRHPGGRGFGCVLPALFVMPAGVEQRT